MAKSETQVTDDESLKEGDKGVDTYFESFYTAP